MSAVVKQVARSRTRCEGGNPKSHICSFQSFAFDKLSETSLVDIQKGPGKLFKSLSFGFILFSSEFMVSKYLLFFLAITYSPPPRAAPSLPEVFEGVPSCSSGLSVGLHTITSERASILSLPPKEGPKGKVQKKKGKKLTNVSFMYVCETENGEMLVFFSFFSPTIV